MDFPVDAPETQGHSVVVRVAGMLGEPQLLVDGAPQTPTEGVYTLPPTGERTKPVLIRLHAPLLDRAPIVEIDGRRVTVAPPIGVGTYLWCLVPLVLLLVFGRAVVPAIVGLALSYVSLYQLRAAPTNRRYAASIVINVLSIALAVALTLMRHHGGHAHAASPPP